MAEGETPTCKWRPGTPCQFNSVGLQTLDGAWYCYFHMPLRAKDRQVIDLQHLLNNSYKQKQYNFAGVQFPEGRYALEKIKDDKAEWNLTDCCFGGVANLDAHGPVDLSRTRFLKHASITVGKGVRGEAVIFESSAHIDAEASSVVALSRATFAGEMRLKLAARPNELLFKGCTFACAPLTISTQEHWPQNCTFLGSKFGEGEPEKDEAQFRELRNLFSGKRSREMEGMFYAYEKRSQRRALPGGWRYWADHIASMLYDWLSEYGSSYKRAFVALLGIQLVFGLLYYFSFCRAGWSATPDWPLIAFTLAQIARPFELLSSRALTWPSSEVAPNPPGSWAVIAAVHSLLSLTALALMLLALRWRFRRE